MVQLTEEMLRYTEASQQELEELILALWPHPGTLPPGGCPGGLLPGLVPKGRREGRLHRRGEKTSSAAGTRGRINRSSSLWLTPIPFSPDLEPMEPVVEADKIYCPGVGDDTANLAVLMLAARYILQHDIASDYEVLFVANSCEEGLGNLKGSRQLMRDYASRTAAVISFERLHAGHQQPRGRFRPV